MHNIFLVTANFYSDIADQLTNAAIQEIEQSKNTYESFTIPGVFEAPAAIAMAIDSGRYDGYISLGCVIRGDTSHYDYVCSESARGINDIAIQNKIALGYGIITAENKDQALIRADINKKNVGGRAAKACLAMMNLKKTLEI